MRIGSIVYATWQGLGVLAKSFVDAGVINDVVVMPHRHWENQSWYPIAERYTPAAARKLVDRCDALLFFETPFDWDLLTYARAKGKKASLMVMYECTPKQLPAQPDQFICPSALDYKYYPTNSVQLPVPVKVPWKLRNRARTFIHNAGHGGLRGRNGTMEFLQALRYVKTPARFLIRSQKRLEFDFSGLHRVDIHYGTAPYDQLYATGDVFVFPEKFNGLSLPLQEAHAAGMLVMCGARYPMTEWLPRDPMIPIKGYQRSAISPRCNEFDEATYDSKEIAATIDAWYDKPIAEFSNQGKMWADRNSWGALKSLYMEVLV